MAYVVTSPCIGTKDTACSKVCPVNCFFEVPVVDLGLEEPADEPKNMLIISPDECIDCGLCAPECPVAAIFVDGEVPEEDKNFIDLNAQWFGGKDGEEIEAARVIP